MKLTTTTITAGNTSVTQLRVLALEMPKIVTTIGIADPDQEMTFTVIESRKVATREEMIAEMTINTDERERIRRGESRRVAALLRATVTKLCMDGTMKIMMLINRNS